MKREPEFFLGRTLPGGYTLTKELGSGTFGTTFEAYLPNDTIPFAVKVFHQAADQLAVAQFAQEAITLAQLKHPNIVPFRRFGIEQIQVFDNRGIQADEHYPFFVMAFANKGDVRRLKPRDSLSPPPLNR